MLHFILLLRTLEKFGRTACLGACPRHQHSPQIPLQTVYKGSAVPALLGRNPELNNAAIRLMKKSKIWVPAVQIGKQVKYRNRLEIKFS